MERKSSQKKKDKAYVDVLMTENGKEIKNWRCVGVVKPAELVKREKDTKEGTEKEKKIKKGGQVMWVCRGLENEEDYD